MICCENVLTSDVTVPQTNRGEKVWDMKSQLVYQGAVWRVQRVGLIKPLALCTDDFLPTLRAKVWRSAAEIHMEAGGHEAMSGREGVPVGGGSWILGCRNIGISHSREWWLNVVFSV